MNRKGIIASVLLCSLMLSSCGGEAEPELKVKTKSETVGEVVESSTDSEAGFDLDILPNVTDTAEFNKISIRIPEETKKKIYQDDYYDTYDMTPEEAEAAKEQRLQERLSKQVTEQDFDIYYMPYLDFMNLCEFKEDEFATKEIISNDFQFAGTALGKPAMNEDDNTETFGSLIFIETYERNIKEIVKDAHNCNTKVNLVIKAICFSSDYLADDYEIVFFGNIRLGDKRNDVEKKIGKGTPKQGNGDVVYYKTSKTTFIITYDSNTVDTVIIINNAGGEPDNTPVQKPAEESSLTEESIAEDLSSTEAVSDTDSTSDAELAVTELSSSSSSDSNSHADSDNNSEDSEETSAVTPTS